MNQCVFGSRQIQIFGYRNSIIIVINNQHYCSLLITIVQCTMYDILNYYYYPHIHLYQHHCTDGSVGYDSDAAVILISVHHIHHSFLSRARSIPMLGLFRVCLFFRFCSFSLNLRFIRPTVDSQSRK